MSSQSSQSATLRVVAVLVLPMDVIASGSRISAWSIVLGLVYVGFWLLADRPWSVWLAAATAPLALLAVARSENVGQVTDLLWVCPALALGFAVRGRRGVAVLVAVVALAVVTAEVLAGRPGLQTLWRLALPMTVAGLAASAFARLETANEELANAREQLAVAAIQEERSRFGRDLHDLLGHTLTVLVAKVRLARRLPVDQAAPELADVEHLALAVLDDVRQAVGGYRGPTLETQIAGAKAALEAAGISFEVSGSPGQLVEASEHVLALSVREAVTNVLRHSGASHCFLTLGRTEAAAWVDVRDDGRAGAVIPGWGLEGLRERAARLKGTVSWGAAEPEGFKVRVTVPADGAEAL